VNLVKRFLILDFQGTLTRLRNPVAFLRKLGEGDDVVVIWTGTPEGLSKEMIEAAHSVAAKPYPFVPFIQELIETHGTPSKVIVCDDNADLGASTAQLPWAFEFPVEYLPATEIETLLGDRDDDRP